MITTTLSILLDLITSYRGVGYLEYVEDSAYKKLVDDIRAEDPQGEFTYIEILPANKDRRKPLARVWRKKEWITEAAKVYKDRRESERNRQESFRKEEIILEVMKAINIACSIDDDISRPIASKIVNSNDTTAATMFGVGVDISSWKISEEALDSIMKELNNI